eukprot:212493-Pleurochrysis_carterae.AAC.10
MQQRRQRRPVPSGTSFSTQAMLARPAQSPGGRECACLCLGACGSRAQTQRREGLVYKDFTCERKRRREAAGSRLWEERTTRSGSRRKLWHEDRLKALMRVKS